MGENQKELPRIEYVEEIAYKINGELNALANEVATFFRRNPMSNLQRSIFPSTMSLVSRATICNIPPPAIVLEPKRGATSSHVSDFYHVLIVRSET